MVDRLRIEDFRGWNVTTFIWGWWKDNWEIVQDGGFL
jgi:hypothetical protein